MGQHLPFTVLLATLTLLVFPTRLHFGRKWPKLGLFLLENQFVRAT
jgi:hypothetical protein